MFNLVRQYFIRSRFDVIWFSLINFSELTLFTFDGRVIPSSIIVFP